jgi:hypothetical protein
MLSEPATFSGEDCGQESSSEGQEENFDVKGATHEA